MTRKVKVLVWLLSGLCFWMFLPGSAQAATLNVNCNGSGEEQLTTIGKALNLLKPEGPNTINVSGSCHERVLIQSFQNLTLNAISGASITDVSGGSRSVVAIQDSTDVTLQGLTINGGAIGVLCADFSVKAMLEFAVDERLIPSNPARGKKLTIPKKGVRRPSGRFLTMEECHALMRTAEGRERLILRIFLVSGLRSQELFLLRANDLESGQIRVDEAFKRAEHGEDRIGEPKTEGSADVVAIPADLESELRAWIQSHGQSGADLLFPSAVGGPIDPSNYLDRTLRPLGIEAGVPDINFAMLRRTCATYFRANLKGAQRQLRHKTPHVTAKHYQQSITVEHRSAVAKLDQELCNPEKKVVSIKRRA